MTKLQREKRRETAAYRKRVREYSQFLRNDRDWDWYHILALLEFKLSRTRKCIVENDVIVDSKKVGAEIREVEILLKRVREDRYFDEISKGFRKKYGTISGSFNKVLEDKSNSPLTIKYSKETPENSRALSKELRALYRRANQMQRDDLKRAFDLMHKNIWGWWD